MGIALKNKFRADLVLCYTAKAMGDNLPKTSHN